MTTHEDALRAAFKAAPDEWNCRKSHLEVIENCIAAYLSALLPEDVAGLVERLRQYEGRQWETTACYNGTRDEAASLIQSQAARIAELEAEAAKKDTALDAAFAYLEGSNPLHASGGYLNTDLRDKVRTARALPNKEASHD